MGPNPQCTGQGDREPTSRARGASVGPGRVLGYAPPQEAWDQGELRGGSRERPAGLQGQPRHPSRGRARHGPVAGTVPARGLVRSVAEGSPPRRTASGSPLEGRLALDRVAEEIVEPGFRPDAAACARSRPRGGTRGLQGLRDRSNLVRPALHPPKEAVGRDRSRVAETSGQNCKPVVKCNREPPSVRKPTSRFSLNRLA